jgi:hypothetical protein
VTGGGPVSFLPRANLHGSGEHSDREAQELKGLGPGMDQVEEFWSYSQRSDSTRKSDELAKKNEGKEVS